MFIINSSALSKLQMLAHSRQGSQINWLYLKVTLASIQLLAPIPSEGTQVGAKLIAARGRTQHAWGRTPFTGLQKYKRIQTMKLHNMYSWFDIGRQDVVLSSAT